MPAGGGGALSLLDFSPSPAAGCYALAGAEEAEPPGRWGQRRRVAPEVRVPLGGGAACAAEAHPRLDLRVGGGSDGRLLLLSEPG